MSFTAKKHPFQRSLKEFFIKKSSCTEVLYRASKDSFIGEYFLWTGSVWPTASVSSGSLWSTLKWLCVVHCFSALRPCALVCCSVCCRSLLCYSVLRWIAVCCHDKRRSRSDVVAVGMASWVKQSVTSDCQGGITCTSWHRVTNQHQAM